VDRGTIVVHPQRLLEAGDAAMIAGFRSSTRFAGDPSLFDDGYAQIRQARPAGPVLACCRGCRCVEIARQEERVDLGARAGLGGIQELCGLGLSGSRISTNLDPLAAKEPGVTLKILGPPVALCPRYDLV